MASGMKVNAQDLETASKIIRENAEKYQEAYIEVFSMFQHIDSVWDGEDNTEFNEKVRSFKNDFVEMSKFFEKLCMHLSLAADAYKKSESSVAVSAEDLNKLTKKTSSRKR